MTSLALGLLGAGMLGWGMALLGKAAELACVEAQVEHLRRQLDMIEQDGKRL